jgi:Do/DeqQ family serine protease
MIPLQRAAPLLLVLTASMTAPPAFGQAPPPARAALGAASTLSPAQVSASTQEAKRLSDAFVAVAERVSPSVVQIDVTVRDERADLLSHFFGPSSEGEPIARGMGSGVVFTPDGAILTNNHVVEAALTITARLRDGRSLPARLVGRDPATDLAIVKVDATGLDAAKFADSEAARVGEWVVAIGSPFGLGYTVTAGVLSAKGRGGLGMNAIEDYLQTDASINPGNSGGPLCNLSGEVLGINTMIVGRGQGIGFAVPSSMAQRVGDQLLKTGHVSRPWLGVAVQDITPELAAAMQVPAGSGALVNSVADGGPAFKANMRPGDVIATLAGHEVHDAHGLIRDTINLQTGQPLALEIIRGGKRYGATITLAERPEAPTDPTPLQQPASTRQGMGLIVRDLSPQQAAQMGLSAKLAPVVTQVAPGSPADRAGLRPGDVILEANGTAEPSSAQMADLARSGSLLLRVKRGEAYFYTALKR